MDLKNNLRTETGWEIIEKSFNEGQVVTTGSNFMIGNGYLGYRGTFEEWGAKEYVACIVTDTWDQADGSRWSELCNIPNGLFTKLYVDDELLTVFDGDSSDYHRELNLKYAVNKRKMRWTSETGKEIELEVEKFASHANHHLLAMNYQFKAIKAGTYKIITGIDGEVWSINGEHFGAYNPIEKDEIIGFELTTQELGTAIFVLEGLKIKGKKPVSQPLIKEEKRHLRELIFELEAGEEVVLEKVVAITHNNELSNPRDQGLTELTSALSLGYHEMLKKHKEHWEKFWTISDIKIDGNTEAQVLARFNIYQAYIATPQHDNLPVGARGLSCQVYQGAAFWDQETYNLPMYIYTHPEIARKLVTYRHDTLNGARRKAKKLGYYGAFYAWTSGKTGDELFPDYFFTDVLTGRKIRNHFNIWQIHISPDVVYGIWKYYEATNDWGFILNHGAEVLFEVAQFLVSRVYFKKDKNRYELIRLLGPDEYHENVDNNAFTNYLSHYALEKACWVYEKMKVMDSERLGVLVDLVGISQSSYEDWKEIAELLYLPEPDTQTGLIEQFDGYFQLEDIKPDELRKRLLDPGEYWGWPNGIAVATQVLKQADVIQLLAMTDMFSEEVLVANYEYYEPRTEHGSSLSPSVHALVASKTGHHKEAYRYFMESSTIDLYNASKKIMSGGSFLGGIHTAAAGGVWLVLVEGFAGFQIRDEGVQFNPALPEAWDELSFHLKVKNCLLEIHITHQDIRISSAKESAKELNVYLNEEKYLLLPGKEISTV